MTASQGASPKRVLRELGASLSTANCSDEFATAPRARWVARSAAGRASGALYEDCELMYTALTFPGRSMRSASDLTSRSSGGCWRSKRQTLRSRSRLFLHDQSLRRAECPARSEITRLRPGGWVLLSFHEAGNAS